MKTPIITLTTDFGLDDAYAGVIKGIILGISPEARVVDLCHTISAYDVPQAAFILGTSHAAFPKGTINVAVVDPGVGSRRLAVVLVTPSAFFVAPDNGVLSHVISDRPCLPGVLAASRLKEGYEAFALEDPRYWRHPVSATFHGRDIFAPVAAHLSLGVAPAALGPRILHLHTFPPACPRRRGNTLIGHVVHVDRFGNLITDIREDDLGKKGVEISVGSHTIAGLSGFYAEGRGLVALAGSKGYIEIALREGNASGLVGAKPGDEVRVSATKYSQPRG